MIAGYECMDEQGLVDLVIAPAEVIHDKEDADENAKLSNQEKQCPVSHTKVMRMLNDCIMWLCF